MGAGSDCYNEYTAFHLFEEYLEVCCVFIIVCLQIFPQQELEDAIVLLKSLLLVKQRVIMIEWIVWYLDHFVLQRMVDRKTNKHLGPSATQTLVLHNKLVIV